jgi:transcriptional regulator with XRE-family HTH domain
MAAKNWTSAQTLKAAREFISPLDNLAHSHMSHYLHGRAIPRGPYLAALSQALEVSEEELLGAPESVAPSAERSQKILPKARPLQQASVQVREVEGGEAWLEINQRVPWATALEILRLLKSAD